MKRILSLFKKPEITFWVLVLIALVASIAVLGIVYWHPEKLHLVKETSAWYSWLSGSAVASITMFLLGFFLFFGARAAGRQSFTNERKNAQGDDVKTPAKAEASPVPVTNGAKVIHPNG